MNSNKPHANLLTVWRIQLVILMSPIALVFTFVFPLRSLWWALCAGLWALVFFGFYLLYLPFALRRISYRMDGRNLYITAGVVIKKDKIVPLDCIQYAAVLASPLDGLLHISNVTVVVPGMRVLLPGLERSAAAALSKALSNADAHP